eukprot:7429244-Alexandrium_andersonii.AAC.1
MSTVGMPRACAVAWASANWRHAWARPPCWKAARLATSMTNKVPFGRLRSLLSSLDPTEVKLQP